MHGYGEGVLHVDLGTGVSEVRPLDAATARAVLGGNGLAARLLWDAVPAGVDPYDPANAVALGVGPITDTLVPGNSRACIATKSPLAGLFFDSTFGGRFPATFKRTGFDTAPRSSPAPYAVPADVPVYGGVRGKMPDPLRLRLDARQLPPRIARACQRRAC